MNTRLVISLLCAAAVAFACGPRSRSEASLVSSAKPSGHVTKSERRKADGINSAFSVNIEPHAIRFALNLTNESKKHVELAFPSGQEYDFAVVDSVGREVYRWGSGRMFTQSLQNRQLDGGEMIRIDERATTKLPQGRYVAVATLRSSNFPVEQRVQFELR
jgi:hypothetical protein